MKIQTGKTLASPHTAEWVELEIERKSVDSGATGGSEI